MFNALDKIGNVISILSTAIARVVLLFIASIMVLQVILRYVFNAALPWPDEAARYCIIWVVLLVGNALLRDRELITVDFFDKFWPARLIRYRDLTYKVLLLFLLWILVKEGLTQAIYGLKTVTTALQIKFFWPYLAIPVGASLMLFQMLLVIFKEIRAILRKES
jgi:TRAP-type transport system small permease protein